MPLLLVDPVERVKHITRLRAKSRRPGTVTADDLAFNKGRIFVYRRPDLEAAIKETNRVSGLVAQLDGILLRERQWPAYAELFHQLCNEPEIRPVLRRLREGQKNSQAIPPPPRRAAPRKKS